jgi:NAD(P)H-flavin reductase
VLQPRTQGLLLPAVPVAGYDRGEGTLALLLDGVGPAAALAAARVRDTARFDGPLGRGFALDSRSRYLLLVADTDGFARVRAAVDEAVASGRHVALLLGARSVAEVFPSSLLPDETEYVVATVDGSLGHRGDAAELVSAYEAWADQCLAAGSPALLTKLATLAAGRDGRMGVARLGRRRGRRAETGGAQVRRRSWLQVALPHPAGCALGICAGCVVEGSTGLQRTCREGPAFAAPELRWDDQR